MFGGDDIGGFYRFFDASHDAIPGILQGLPDDLFPWGIFELGINLLSDFYREILVGRD